MAQCQLASDGLGSCKQKEFSQLFLTNMKYLLSANSWGDLRSPAYILVFISNYKPPPTLEISLHLHRTENCSEDEVL